MAQGGVFREENQPEFAGDDEEEEVRDIHALIPPPSTVSRRSSVSVSEIMSDNFNTMSREFNALVLAGSNMRQSSRFDGGDDLQNQQIARIGDNVDTIPIRAQNSAHDVAPAPPPAHRVKEEEVESKIAAWQTAEIAKANNRFKRQEVIINNWERQQAEKAAIWLKNIERKLEEKKAKAMEKMRNELAEARRSAAEKRASAEANRGTKVATVLERSKLMKALGRAPAKFPF